MRGSSRGSGFGSERGSGFGAGFGSVFGAASAGFACCAAGLDCAFGSGAGFCRGWGFGSGFAAGRWRSWSRVTSLASMIFGVMLRASMVRSGCHSQRAARASSRSPWRARVAAAGSSLRAGPSGASSALTAGLP